MERVRHPGHTALALALVLAAALALASPAAAQDLASFEKRLTEHRLPNGLTFLIYERPGAPVVSFYTHVNVGAAQEVPGITGMAHMFEHMAFKGTTVIGTTDWTAEKAALDKVEAAWDAFYSERTKIGGGDPAKLKELEKAFKDAQEAADRYIVKNEFGDIIDRQGGTGLNASTGSDQTNYFYSLPANKLELWAYLESERFRDPVFREFYKERDVVMEERRLRTESQPTGRLMEQFLATAFVAHPYKQPVVGYMSDLQSFSATDAKAFYAKYYVPSNIVIAIVGDVKAKEIIPVLDRYFGRLPPGQTPAPLRTVEPKAIAEKQVLKPDKAQPVYLEGYHRAAVTSPDDATYQAIAEVLGTGRTSRLYRSLVRDQKVAVQASVFPSFPGGKYPALMVFFGIPAPGRTNEEVQAAIRAEIDKIRSQPVTDEELAMVKSRAKASLVRGLQSNMGIARQLGAAQTIYGDWREIFTGVAEIDAVTKDDIQRVAKATFVPDNRTVAMIVNEDAKTAKN